MVAVERVAIVIHGRSVPVPVLELGELAESAPVAGGDDRVLATLFGSVGDQRVQSPAAVVVLAAVVAESDAADSHFASVRHCSARSGRYTIVATSFHEGTLFPYGLRVYDCGCDEGELKCWERTLGTLIVDDETGFRSDRHYHDAYRFEGEAGTRFTVNMDVTAGDPAP